MVNVAEAVRYWWDAIVDGFDDNETRIDDGRT